MLHVAGNPAPPCYIDSPACDRSVVASQPSAGDPILQPAVAAIVGLAILGLALRGRRSGLQHVVS
jgi:hypothetical protein